MIGGASWTWWICFHVVVVGLLLADSLLPGHRRDEQPSPALAWIWTGVLALAAAAFAGWIAFKQGHVPALQFVAGYTIEISLSIDNLFVFLVLFQGFHISAKRQHTALLWGIGGAILLRAIFIATGITLLRRFEWITYVFGLFLLYAAWRLLRGGSARSAIPSWVRNLQPSKGSLLPVIIAVELTDLLFAVDSIPAVLAVSHDPFVVYTSNIAAILGLRSLYSALSDLLGRLHYLHYGLAALLAFVAFKMLAAHWIDLPITTSLAIIGGILAVCAIASAIAGRKHKPASSVAQPDKRGHE
jgi:predicted tellurium resistance membrane protein TerC